MEPGTLWLRDDHVSYSGPLLEVFTIKDIHVSLFVNVLLFFKCANIHTVGACALPCPTPAPLLLPSPVAVSGGSPRCS